MTHHITAWLGIDVSSDSFDAAIVQGESIKDFTKVKSKNFSLSKKGVNLLIKWLARNYERITPGDIGVVMESTGSYSLKLYKFLSGQENWGQISIVNPWYIKSYRDSLAQRNKTDPIDSKAIAFYGRERTPAAYQPREPKYQEIRDLLKTRRLLEDQKSSMNQVIGSTGSQTGVDCLKRAVAALEDEIRHLESKIRETIEKDEKLKRDFKIMMTIPGVGEVIIWTVFAELGDLRRFKRSRQLAAMVGVAPTVFMSGTSVRGKSRFSKQGSPELRKVLYMGATSVVRVKRDNSMIRTYLSMLDKGKARKSALGAVMRKLIVTMRALLISNEPYCASGRPPMREVAS